MSEDRESFVVIFNDAVKAALPMLFMTRASELQRQAQQELARMSERVAARKRWAIDRLDEDEANLLLACENALEGISAILQMWIFLRGDDPNSAWTHLVQAQAALAACLAAHDGFESFQQLIERLDAVEHIVFPPQTYVSAGFEAGGEICSICQRDYDECPHLVGRPYMGEFCYVSATDLRIHHVAIVQEPASKHCRMTTEETAGGVRDHMTWRITPADPGKPVPKKGARFQSVVARER